MSAVIRPFNPRPPARRAQQTRHVRVVAAGVRDADYFPRIIGRGQYRGVGQAGVFLDGKRVHVSPREHGLTFAVTQDADNARPTNPFEDFVTEFLSFDAASAAVLVS